MKPTVFNHKQYTDLEADYMILKVENEQLKAQLSTSQRRAQDARNELCLKCGRYHEAHNGSCDGCRWKEPSYEAY